MKQLTAMNIWNIPKHKNCTNCGKCCGLIPASAEERTAIRKYLTENQISPVERADKTICPFRDEKERKCLIYKVRPMICRLYGVAKGVMQCPNGNSAEIDGELFLIKEDVKFLNFEKW